MGLLEGLFCGEFSYVEVFRKQACGAGTKNSKDSPVDFPLAPLKEEWRSWEPCSPNFYCSEGK